MQQRNKPGIGFPLHEIVAEHLKTGIVHIDMDDIRICRLDTAGKEPDLKKVVMDAPVPKLEVFGKGQSDQQQKHVGGEYTQGKDKKCLSIDAQF